MSAYAAVEIGGTKTDVAFGTSIHDLSEPIRVQTTTPAETFETVFGILRSREIEAVGVACFGPIRLGRVDEEYGTILATPKAGWSGQPVYQAFREALDMPIALTTDVIGAAIGENRWGATQGMASHVYVTVGTGIGAGIAVDGRFLAGEHHPEAGHIAVSRMEGDSHPGTCPFHGPCLEGMASGPALEARFGPPHTWAGNDLVLDVVSHYLAQGMLGLVYTVVPERIVVGGGVSTLPGFHDRLRVALGDLISGYPEAPDLDLLISPPGLGALSGLAGAVALAREWA